MADRVTKALMEELAILKEKLEATDIYKEIQVVERMIARRQSQGDGSETANNNVVSPAMPRSLKPLASPVSLIKSRVAAMLEGVDHPIATKEIFARLVDGGVIVPGDSPQSNLSAHLSRDETFTSWGRSGWTLASTIVPEEELISSIVDRYISSSDAESIQIWYNDWARSGDAPPDQIVAEISNELKKSLGRNLIASEIKLIAEFLREFIEARYRKNDYED